MKQQPVNNIADHVSLNADELNHATVFNSKVFDGKGSVRFERFFRYGTELTDAGYKSSKKNESNT